MPNSYDDCIARKVNCSWLVDFFTQYTIRINTKDFKRLFDYDEPEIIAVLIATIKQKYQETQVINEGKNNYIKRLTNAEINETLEKLLDTGYFAEDLIRIFAQIKWHEIVKIFESYYPEIEVKQIQEVYF